MPDARPAVKLDFTTGLDTSASRPKVDASTTLASVAAGRELGFQGRMPSLKLDGRRLRSRGANIQLNLKVTAEEKEAIIRAAAAHIQDPSTSISTLGEFVVFAVNRLKERA